MNNEFAILKCPDIPLSVIRNYGVFFLHLGKTQPLHKKYNGRRNMLIDTRVFKFHIIMSIDPLRRLCKIHDISFETLFRHYTLDNRICIYATNSILPIL